MGDRYVITAAHCTDGKHPENITILVGATTLGWANFTTTFFRNVSDIRQHSVFTRRSDGTVTNDISVLVLSSPLDLFTYPNIKPACLPTTEIRADMYGRDAVVSGWGWVGVSEHAHSHLQEIRAKIRPHCSNYKGE